MTNNIYFDIGKRRHNLKLFIATSPGQTFQPTPRFVAHEQEIMKKMVREARTRAKRIELNFLSITSPEQIIQSTINIKERCVSELINTQCPLREKLLGSVIVILRPVRVTRTGNHVENGSWRHEPGRRCMI